MSVPDSPFTIDQASAEDVLNKEPPLTTAQPIDSSGNSNIRISTFKLISVLVKLSKKDQVYRGGRGWSGDSRKNRSCLKVSFA